MATNIISFLARHLSPVFQAIRAAKDIWATTEFKKHVNCRGRVDLRYPLFLRGGKFMTVGNGLISEPGLRIECIDHYKGQILNPVLMIGERVGFGYNCHVGCSYKIIIGNDVLFGSNVLITDHNHGQFCEELKDVSWRNRKLFVKGAVHIEDCVWIGDNVSIMSGVTIGKGSVIGANSVVTHDIPPYSMAAGCPAKVIKSL